MKQKNSPLTDITLEFLKTQPLPEYSEAAGKKERGKLLIVAGSRRLPGGAILAARAAGRSGCGGVRLAVPESIATAIGIAIPELMVIPLPETSAGTIALGAGALLQEQLEACDAAVFGPGLDNNPETQDLLQDLASDFPLPSVLDASALRALGTVKTAFTTPRIMTPHLQEMSALGGQKAEAIEADRQKAASKFAQDSQVVLVLKGHETIVANHSGAIYKNTAGTRGLGTAGSGDVLAGLIGGLLAQMPAEATRAALWGVHLHALAGEACEKEWGDDGMTASDLIMRLPGTLRYARKQTEKKNLAERTGLRPA